MYSTFVWRRWWRTGSDSQGCLKASDAPILQLMTNTMTHKYYSYVKNHCMLTPAHRKTAGYLLFTTSNLEMKSLASSDASTNSCSSKFHLQAKMLFRVSLSSSPRKGQRPLRLTGRDRRSLASVCGRVCAHVFVCLLTACRWWRRGSTCLCWTTQSRSWWLQEQETLECRNSPAVSPVVCIYVGIYFKSIHQKSITFCMITAANKTKANTGTYILARPKSMIFILFVTLLTHRMFSGWNLEQNKTTEVKWLIELALSLF